jgi:hypothetical protein
LVLRRAGATVAGIEKTTDLQVFRQGSVVIDYSPAVTRASIESLRECLDAALQELSVWKIRAPDPDPTPPDFYAGLREQLMGARRATTIQQLDAAVQAIVHGIVDSGPLTGDFLPSLHTLADALQRRRDRR